MAWYTTGTIAVSGTTVTGTGTNFLDNTQSIGSGQALLIPGSGTVKMYEVASVQSATKLTLKTSAGAVAAGQAYAILSFYTDSVPDFARRLAAQLSYYQSQMDGWQQIMTGTGSITMTAPDGTTVTISSFSKLTADVAAAMTDKGNLTNTIDLNTLGAAASWGVYTQTANANALATLNYPEQKAGTLLCTKAAYSGVIQTYIPFDSGAVYTRALAGNWNGTDGPWGVWKMVGASFRTQGSVDLNTFTGAQLFVGGTFTNGPSTMGNATAFVQCLANGTNSLTAQIAIYTTSGRMFTRTNVSGTWTAWAESLTTNSFGTAAGTAAQGNDARFNTIDGNSGGSLSSPITVNASGNYAIVGNTLLADSTGYTGRFCLISGSSSTYDVQIHYRLVNNQYHCVRFIQSGIETFRAQNNGACYAVSFNPTSDSNLKFNKKFIENPILNYVSLRGMTYELNGDRKAGIIAQDAEKFLPESVTTNPEPVVLENGTILEETKSLDYGGTSAAGVEAFKALFPLLLKCLDNPNEAREDIKKIIAATNYSTDDANETDMKMEWALLNPPVTPVEEQPAEDDQASTDESGS